MSTGVSGPQGVEDQEEPMLSGIISSKKKKEKKFLNVEISLTQPL